MSDCQNCFNGCTEIVSDRCVKYTGIAIPGLGIQTGDTLSFVEQALSTFLLSALNGTGIKINVSDVDICTLVQKYLPTCGDLTIVDISKALIQAACDLQEQVDVIDGTLAALNADYTIGCLTGVTASSDTHAIVQATINKLCALQLDVTALALDLETNYVSVDTIDSYIAAYLASIGTSTLISSKMVPYSILPFYGDLTGKFDGTGAGLGDWARIFLCNGLNTTPDLRGRVPVGVTAMSGAGFPAQTQPGLNGNPDYNTKGITTFGANQVTLNATQMPLHTHVGATIAAGEHTHTVLGYIESGSNDGSGGEPAGYFGTVPTTSAGSHTHPVTISSEGGGLAHSNIQPVISVYYIIYIP
jgi:microcystin-dependent protein